LAAGVVINGTASATYRSVPHFAAPAERNRAFSWFYAGTVGAGAIAPTIAGFIGDTAGVTTTIVIVASLVLPTLPLSLPLRVAFYTREA
jgi:MFS transporter, FSR family, fosmidomycin resistance protein